MKRFENKNATQNSVLIEFKKACQKIEQDKNFQPEISPEELLALVIDEHGKARYDVTKKAIAIIPTSLIPTSPDGESLGALYIGAFAGYFKENPKEFFRWYPSHKWRTDCDWIFVNKKGKASIHSFLEYDKIDLNSSRIPSFFHLNHPQNRLQ